MQPVTGFYPVAKWFLRIALLFFVFKEHPINTNSINLFDLGFIADMAFSIFAVLLFVGGFLKDSITILSAFVLFALIIVFDIILNFSGPMNINFSSIAVLGITMLFIAKGNRN